MRSVCLSVSVSVCLSASISLEPLDRSSRNVLCRSPVTVARSSFGTVAIRYALPVFMDDVTFDRSGPYGGRCDTRAESVYECLLFNIGIKSELEYTLYTVSQKTVQNCFCQNFIKSPPILTIFGRKMAKRLELCQVHSLSTSSNLRHHATVLNADVPNCYTTLKAVNCNCNKLSNDLISTH